MTFTLGLNQRALLETALTQAQAADVTNSTGAYAKAYEMLFAMISVGPSGTLPTIINENNAGTIDLESFDLTYTQKFEGGFEPAPGVDKGAWIFLRGVSEVNWRPVDNPDLTANTDYSEFIREYTNRQHKARFGKDLTDEELQNASDSIAYKILDDVLTEPNIGEVPTIDRIATEDARAAVEGETEINAAPIFDQGQVAGWVGNPFLLPVGHDDSCRENILHEGTNNTDTYDCTSSNHFNDR